VHYDALAVHVCSFYIFTMTSVALASYPWQIFFASKHNESMKTIEKFYNIGDRCGYEITNDKKNWEIIIGKIHLAYLDST
jgi:hypothetical protein